MMPDFEMIVHELGEDDITIIPVADVHLSRKDADDNPSYDIMAKLDLEHLWRENIAFVKVQLGKKLRDNGQRTAHYERPTYNLVVTHGSGGGIYTGTAVLRAERFGYVIDGMDALIVGHTHKPFVTQPGKIQIDSRNNNVKVVPFKVISSSAWMEWGGYAARKMLLPSTHMKQELILSAHNKEMEVRVK